MKESKLIKLLKSLSIEELRRFRKALQSPYFTNNSNLLSLFDLLRKYHPDFSTSKITKVKIFEKLFPNRIYNDNKVRRLLSEFVFVLEDFLLNEELKRAAFKKKKMLLGIYGRRNLYEFFEKGTQELIKEQEATPFRDMEFYGEMVDLNYDFFFHPFTIKHTLQDDALKRLMESVDKLFVLTKYRLGSEMKNREKILNKTYDIRFMNHLLNEAEGDFMKNNSSFELFKLLFELYDKVENETVFFKLKKKLEKKIKTIRRTEKSLFLTQLINYTIQQLNVGKTAFYKEGLDLYKLALDNGLVLENQRISPAVFGNVVLFGCNAKEFKWTKDFMEEFEFYLKESLKEDTIAHNMGLWYFHQNDFEQAYDKLINHSFAPAFQPKVRLNIIRILFEQFLRDQSFFELLIAQIESLEKFLHRNKLIPVPLREADINFILVTKKLATGLFERKDLRGLRESLLKQINEKVRIAGKRWLLQKVTSIREIK